MRRDVFQAIADPTRREIINLVAHQSLNLNAVAENFNVSRPAISKHIKILTECGLIVINQQGRERYCEAKLEKLNEVSDWVEQYKKFWESKLDALEEYLIQLQTAKARNVKSSADNLRDSKIQNSSFGSAQDDKRVKSKASAQDDKRVKSKASAQDDKRVKSKAFAQGDKRAKSKKSTSKVKKDGNKKQGRKSNR